jgi:1-acyl-sn-glycerol-3-phosphate acyltransferase
MRFLGAARRVPGRGAVAVAWFDLWETLFELLVRVVYRLRVDGKGQVPRTGPAIFVSNHQSFLDPVANGVAVQDRQFTAIARRSLFRFPPVGWLLRSWGAIAIDEKRGEAESLRAALAELAAGRCVLVYPEGTRSEDGRLKPFRRGFMLLQRKSGSDVVPMAIAGSIDAWPKGQSLPGLSGRVQVKVGAPIPASELASLGSDAALERIRLEVARLLEEANAELRRRTGGRWPLKRAPADPVPPGTAP